MLGAWDVLKTAQLISRSDLQSSAEHSLTAVGLQNASRHHLGGRLTPVDGARAGPERAVGSTRDPGVRRRNLHDGVTETGRRFIRSHAHAAHAGRRFDDIELTLEITVGVDVVGVARFLSTHTGRRLEHVGVLTVVTHAGRRFVRSYSESTHAAREVLTQAAHPVVGEVLAVPARAVVREV